MYLLYIYSVYIYYVVLIFHVYGIKRFLKSYETNMNTESTSTFLRTCHVWFKIFIADALICHWLHLHCLPYKNILPTRIYWHIRNMLSQHTSLGMNWHAIKNATAQMTNKDIASVSLKECYLKHNHSCIIHNLLAFLSSYSHSGTPQPESGWLYETPHLSWITNAAGLLQPWLSSLSSSLSFLVPIIWWSVTDLSPCFSRKVKKTSVRWKFLSTFTIESAMGSQASTPF